MAGVDVEVIIDGPREKVFDLVTCGLEKVVKADAVVSVRIRPPRWEASSAPLCIGSAS